MFVQYVHRSWQMKEQLYGISILLFGEIDKLFMLQHKVCGIDKYPVDSIVSTMHILINTCKRSHDKTWRLQF